MSAVNKPHIPFVLSSSQNGDEQDLPFDGNVKLPQSIPSTPAYLEEAVQLNEQYLGQHTQSPRDQTVLVDDAKMKSAFDELKNAITDMEQQLQQFDEIVTYMKANRVTVDQEGIMTGAFDDDDIASWEADALRLKSVKLMYETDFGKRIYMYEKKVQDASKIVELRMRFFNEVNQKYNLLKKRPALMAKMARKQAELVYTLAETQKILFQDMRDAVQKYHGQNKSVPT